MAGLSLKSKTILKSVPVVSRSERSKIRALAESLRQEFQPQNPFEQFLYEKLIIDISRLSKLYKYEQTSILNDKNLVSQFDYGRAERFIRYKKSIEQDIKDGYTRLEALKDARSDGFW